MFKKVIIGLIFVALAVLAGQATTITPGPMAYWIVGTVNDLSDSILVDGRTVVFYQDDSTYNTNYVTGIISGNTFMLNAPYIWPLGLTVGETYKAAIIQGEDGYGADPVDVTISGVGFDTASGLTLAYGAGPGVPGAEQPPSIRVWFGNRLYQPGVYGADRQFVISATPDLKIDLSIDEPYSLAGDISGYSIIVDPGTGAEQALSLTASNMTQKVYAAGTDLRSFSLEYSVQDELSDGPHVFKVSAQSAGTLGTPATATEYASVEVMGGPVQIVGVPLTYPSPYSITKDRIVTIQYTLSCDANIDIYLIDPTGKRIKKILCNAGTEGGSAGINKVTWDGRTDFGYLAGNAIYVGTLLSRDDNRLLAKVKMTIVD